MFSKRLAPGPALIYLTLVAAPVLEVSTPRLAVVA
jgi:hypothetical protein